MFESTGIRLRIDCNVRVPCAAVRIILMEYESTGEKDSSNLKSSNFYSVNCLSVCGIDGELQEAEFKLSEDKFSDVVFIMILAKYSSAEFCIFFQILYFSKLKCRISALSICC